MLENEFPEHFNNTLPNSGLLGCFCLHVLAQSDVDHASAVEFLNPETKQMDTLCETWLDEWATINLMSTLAVGAVIVVNEGLKGFFRTLVDFEGHETHTQEILSLALKLFVAMLVNTALLVVLIAGNLNLFTNGRESTFTQWLEQGRIFSGARDVSYAYILKLIYSNSMLASLAQQDFTWKWYLDVGTAIAITMFINVFALNASSFSAAIQTKLFRCVDRGCSFDFTRTSTKLQVELEKMYTGPKVGTRR